MRAARRAPGAQSRSLWLLLALVGVSAACGGIAAGRPPATPLVRTALPDEPATHAALARAARVRGCVLHTPREPSTRLLARCGRVHLLLSSGPWAGVLSAQCAETRDASACEALVAGLARVTVPAATAQARAPAQSAVR